jgi:uncharacterized protein YggE
VITTTATGHASAAPDTVTIELAVHTQAPTAGQALAANSGHAANLIAALKGSGTKAPEIRTSGLSIWPVHGDSGAEITGYQVSNNVRVRSHDVDSAGSLIDTAVDAAGDAIRVEQLSFTIADETELRTDARTAAVTQALAQARELAEAAGVSLGRLHSITEGTDGPPMPKMRGFERAAMAMSTPMEPGTQTVSVTVTVQFEVGER